MFPILMIYLVSSKMNKQTVRKFVDIFCLIFSYTDIFFKSEFQIVVLFSFTEAGMKFDSID